MQYVIGLTVELNHCFHGNANYDNMGYPQEKIYSVAVEFREHMIYVKAAMNKNQRSDPRFAKTAVAPY